MALINEKVEQYRSILNMFSDNNDRYKFLIDLGRKSLPFPEEFRLENFKVKGCLSQVWLVPKFEEGKIKYLCDSDAAIVKGTVTLISDIYSDNTPYDIINYKTDLMEKLDLGNILSMNRRNGAYNMLSMIKEHARMYTGE